MIPGIRSRSLYFNNGKKFEIAEGDIEKYHTSTVALAWQEDTRVGPAPDGFYAKQAIYYNPAPNPRLTPTANLARTASNTLKLAESKGIESLGFLTVIGEPYKLTAKDWALTLSEEARHCLLESRHVKWIGVIFPEQEEYTQAELELFPKKPAPRPKYG